AGVVAFAAASPRAASYSGNRAQFLGRNRSRANPAALDYVSLDNRCGPGLDPAAALQVPAVTEPGQATEIVFLLGEHATVFGVRVQDALAYLYSAPGLSRAHLLAAASRQFVQGDVQHWWHPQSGLGVRTRCCGDLLWLDYAVASCVEVTGDASVLDSEVRLL